MGHIINMQDRRVIVDHPKPDPWDIAPSDHLGRCIAELTARRGREISEGRKSVLDGIIRRLESSFDEVRAWEGHQ